MGSEQLACKHPYFICCYLDEKDKAFARKWIWELQYKIKTSCLVCQYPKGVIFNMKLILRVKQKEFLFLNAVTLQRVIVSIKFNNCMQ